MTQKSLDEGRARHLRGVVQAGLGVSDSASATPVPTYAGTVHAYRRQDQCQPQGGWRGLTLERREPCEPTSGRGLLSRWWPVSTVQCTVSSAGRWLSSLDATSLGAVGTVGVLSASGPCSGLLRVPRVSSIGMFTCRFCKQQASRSRWPFATSSQLGGRSHR